MSLSTSDSDRLKIITNPVDTENPIACSEAEAREATSGDVSDSLTKDLSDAAGTVSVKQEDNCETEKLTNAKKPLHSPINEHEKESIPETQSSNILNERESQSNTLDLLRTESGIHNNARENTIAESEDRVDGKILPKQAVIEETAQSPKLNSAGNVGIDTEQNSLENQNAVDQSGSECDQRIISKNDQEQLPHENPVPGIKTYQSSDANENEFDKKSELSVAVEKRDPSSLNLANSKEYQLLTNNDNSKEYQLLTNNAETSKAPETLVPGSQSIITKTSSGNAEVIPASDPENLEKDCENFSNSKTTKDQTDLNNSKIIASTGTPFPSIPIDPDTPYLNKETKNFKLHENSHDFNLRTAQETPSVLASRLPKTTAIQTKTPVNLVSKVSAENSTLYQSNRFSQPTYNSNRPILPNNQKPSEDSASLQRASGSYIENSTLLPNKYVNEINQTNTINQYNANQNNVMPLNFTDTRSKLNQNNYKTPNPNHFEIPNMFQQHYQPAIQSISSSNLPVNGKEVFEYDLRFSFQATPGINNGLSHNQRSYFKSYDGQSMQYAVNPCTASVRRDSPCDNAYTVGNGVTNNQTAGNFSVQQFQQYTNQFGYQYLFMWPNPSDQMTDADKLKMSQPSNQGTVSSCKQPCKNIFPNPVNNNVYLNQNDGKLCKSQFADGRTGFYLEPNQGNTANTPISLERINQQVLLQPNQRTRNTNSKDVTSHSETYRNRNINNNNNNNNNNNIITFPVSQNSLQWGQSSEPVHHQNAVQTGNDLKTKLPHIPQSNSQSLARSQTNNCHLQRSSIDHLYPESHFPLTNTTSFPTTDQIPPTPKIQNSNRSQFQTGNPKYSIGSQSSTPNLVISNFQGPKMTTMATVPASPTTLETSKKENAIIGDGSRLASDPYSEAQRYRANITEFSTIRSGQSMSTYYTQPTMENSGKLGAQFTPVDMNIIRPNYENSSTSEKGQKDSILTWSQYYQQCVDPTRPLHNRGYMNYDSQQRGQNLTPYNVQQNINSPVYIPQSFNYRQQNLSTADGYQETLKPLNTSNARTKTANLVSTYNYIQQNPSSADGYQGTLRRSNSSFDRKSSHVEITPNYSQQNQSTSNSLFTNSNSLNTYNNPDVSGRTFENVRTGNQPKVSAEKLSVSQEIPHNMAAEKETLKAAIPQRSEEFPVKTDTNKSNSAGNDQTQESNCASGLYPIEISDESIKSRRRLPPLSVSGSIRKPDDFLGKTLTNQNSRMTSEESFLFSDFDPLFTSSLLTNELEYFPETNAAFDQCFEDAASVTMAMVALNESKNREILDSVDTSQVHALQQQQQQLSPLLNITTITTNNVNGGSSLTDVPSSEIQYNQVPASQITLTTNQTTNQYDSAADNNKRLVQLTNESNEAMIGYIPGVDLVTLSSKTSRSDIDKPASSYQNDSVPNGYTDLYSTNSASHMAIPIVYDTPGTKLVNTKSSSARLCDSGPGIKRRNRQKSMELKGPPKRRGRPPKNPPVDYTNCPSAQSTKQERTIIGKPQISSNTGTDIVGKILPKPGMNYSSQAPTNLPVNSVTPKFDITNTSSSLPICAKLSAESETPGDCIGTDTTSFCTTDTIDSQKSGSLLSENTGENSLASTKSKRELSDREVIDVVTKCLESISRNEDQNDDQILRKMDTNSIQDSTVMVGMDSPSGSDAISQDEQSLSKEETLMKAYMELKKKLEERMSRTLWRQSYLKRHEPKTPKYSRKLSKKECMTAYSGTISLGPNDDVFSRYPNHIASSDAGNLVNAVDSTSTFLDTKSDIQKDLSNQYNHTKIESEPVKDLASTQDQIPSSSDHDTPSPKLPDPPKSSTLRLPSIAEVVRNRLSNDTPPLNTGDSGSLALEVLEESPVPNHHLSTELAESAEKNNQQEKVKHAEESSVNNLQPGLSPRHLPLQPYSPSPLLPPPPPPPMPPKVVYCVSKREKKVGPTIVENARNCFEAIGNYLTKANSDFDSFLISYANIVQGLLNCKADKYSRIKAILLNRADHESEANATGEESNSKETVTSDRDIDASDIQGDAARREDEIDVELFNSSYADVVKVILSSRADEYRNIKQALSKHICGFTEMCREPTSNSAKKVNERGTDFDVPVSVPTGSGDKSSAAWSKTEKHADPNASNQSASVTNEVNNVILSKDEQKSSKIQGKMANLPIKRRRKRKTQERPEDVGNQSKLLVDDGILETKTNKKRAPRQRVKKLFKTGNALKERKRSSFDENENSSRFRIILSSNSFIEQDVSYSDLNFKLKLDSNVDKDENPESRRPVSSDDGFVEESTGDYIMNMDSESGGETKAPGISENESSTGKDHPKLDVLKNTNILENTQSESFENKTTINTDSSEYSKNMCSSGETLQVSVDEVGDMDEVAPLNTENNNDVKRKRSSRRSAGVGAIKCPCGCCDNESSLKNDLAEDAIRVNTSFRKRNRAKIIKPKRANPLKRRRRSQKMETRPQKKMSPIVNHKDDVTPICSDDEEPYEINMSEDLIKRLALKHMPSRISASSGNEKNVKMRRELYSDFVSDFDSTDSSGCDIFANPATEDSGDNRNLKKPTKIGSKKTQKNRYKILSNRKSALIDDDTALICADKNKPKINEENETSTTDLSSLNPTAKTSEDVSTTSVREFRQEKPFSKARISFKEFVPNITSTPLANIPKESLVSKYPVSYDSIESYKDSSKILPCNIKVESKENFPSLDLEGDDRIGLTAQDGRLNLNDNDAVGEFKTDVNVDSYSTSINTNFKSREGEEINKTSEKQNGTSSCEDRLRSLIETITEINTTTKQIDEDRSNSVNCGFDQDLNESVMENDLEPFEGGQLGLQSRDEMKVKTEIVNRIDETFGQTGMNDIDDNSSITSSDSCSDGLSSSSSSEENDPKNFMEESHDRSDLLEVKIPSPLNSRKRDRKLKVTSVYENKLIIRKTWQDKTKKVHNVKRKTKNIFDILSSNETEEDRGDLKGRTLKKKVYSDKKALPVALGVKEPERVQRPKSKMPRTKNGASTNQNQNIGYDTEKLQLSNNGDRSFILSEKTKSPGENNLKMVKDHKKTRKITKRFLAAPKALPESKVFDGSGSNQKDFPESSQRDTKIAMNDRFKKQLLDSNMKPKKPSKIPKTSSSEPSFHQQKIRVSFNSPKGKKRKTSSEATNYNSLLSTEMESTETLAVNDISKRIGKITGKSYSGANFGDSSINIQGDKDKSRLKLPAVDVPPLQCTYCPRYFKRPSELLCHIRTHTEERPFACEQCTKCFASSAALRRHRRTHSSERKHICETCGRGFVQHYGMLVHQLIHSGLKPHKCPDCSSAFRTKGSLSSHRRRRHPEELEKERLNL